MGSQFLDIARGPMLNFLSLNTTIEEFIGDNAIPLEAETIFALRSKNGFIIKQAFRIAEGNALHVVSYAEWSPMSGLQCVYTYCDFYTFYDLEGMPIRASTKSVSVLWSCEYRICGHILGVLFANRD